LVNFTSKEYRERITHLSGINPRVTEDANGYNGGSNYFCFYARSIKESLFY